MSWQMALDYIRALIWPGVVLTLGTIFRKQLASLFSRVESLETPLGTVAFDSQAAAVAEETDGIATSIAEEVATAESDRERELLSDVGVPAEPADASPAKGHHRAKKSDDVFSDLLQLAETETTAAVLGAWREVDAAIRKATVERGLFRARPRSLAPTDVLTPELARSATDLSELRNRVVHEGDVIPTVSGARSYVTAARRIVEALDLANSPALRYRQYEEQVLGALSVNSVYVQPNEGDQGFDAYCETEAGGSFAVEVLFRRSKLTMADIKRVTEQMPLLATGVLVLTNAPLSQEVREFNATSGNGRPSMEVVQWRDSTDDDLLVRAIARVAGLKGV